jgi:hypothetical protein
MRLKAPLRQYGLKEPLKVDVFVLNRAAVLLAIVEGEPEREAILENGGEHETDSTGSGFLTSVESRVRKTAATRSMPIVRHKLLGPVNSETFRTRNTIAFIALSLELVFSKGRPFSIYAKYQLFSLWVFAN